MICHARSPYGYGKRAFFLSRVKNNQRHFFFRTSCINHIVSSCVQEHKRSVSKGRMRLMVENKITMVVQKFHVLFSPWERAATIRLCPAVHADFIPIEERRCTGPSKKQHCPQSEKCKIYTEPRFILILFDTPHSSVCSRQKAGMIMIGKLIHAGIQCIFRKMHHIVAHGIEEQLPVSELLRHCTVRVLLHPRKKPAYRLHKSIVVHNTVPLCSL